MVSFTWTDCFHSYLEQVLIQDVNLVKKAVKSQEPDQPGKLILTEAPIHHSNCMLYSTEKNVVSRVGHRIENGKKVRYLIKTGETLPERAPIKSSEESA